MGMNWTEEDLAAFNSRRGGGETPPAKKPSKYRNQPCEVDGIHFPSTLEAARYLELRRLEAAGEITHFLRQVPFHLPGGVIYRLDFLVFWASGRIGYEDTKGFETPMFKVKKKLVEAEFPVVIELVKRK